MSGEGCEAVGTQEGKWAPIHHRHPVRFQFSSFFVLDAATSMALQPDGVETPDQGSDDEPQGCLTDNEAMESDALEHTSPKCVMCGVTHDLVQGGTIARAPVPPQKN